MSEELLQRESEPMGEWALWNIGATTVNDLARAGIIEKRDYGSCGQKKPDALVVSGTNVIAMLEYKTPQQLRTPALVDSAIRQELEVAKRIGAGVFLVTDSAKTYWINPSTGNMVLDEDGNRVADNFSKDSDKVISLLKRCVASLSESNDALRAKQTVNPLPLARQVWQDLWHISGASPENCLYTFVEIFVFKYLSDLGVLSGLHSFSTLLDSYRDNSENDVLEYYVSTIRPEIKRKFPKSLSDGTTIINGSVFVSKDNHAIAGYSTTFRKILIRFEQFGPLENIDKDFKSRLFETFLKESISKKNWGQYFTPLKVVQSIVKMADVRPGMKVCDPACGVGKFLLESVSGRLDEFYRVENGEVKRTIELIGFDKGFDKDEQKTIILAKANMLIYLSAILKEHPAATEGLANLFNETFVLKTHSALGTLDYPAVETYDLILTNPPYVMSGSSTLKEEVGKSTELLNHYRINAMGVEGLFVEWIIRALKPGGKAFVIVPDGIMNRENDKRLRQFIKDETIVDAVISLPENTFYSTPKKTYVMALTKKPNGFGEQKSPVFTYYCSEVGESRDVRRYDLSQNDLEDAAIAFNMFKGSPFDYRPTNARCRIYPIKEFTADRNWSIDRWWSHEDKVAAGIIEEDNRVNVLDFADRASDVSASISEYEEALRELETRRADYRISGMRLVELADESLFELEIGKRILKDDCRNDFGDIPVYSANVKEPFAMMSTSNRDNFEKPCVLWGIDGNFELNVMEAGEPFGTTDHCGAIRILDDAISPHYLKYAIEQVKDEYGFDRGLRASVARVRAVQIAIPVDEEGKFDLTAQLAVAEEYRLLQELLDTMSNAVSSLKRCGVSFS